MKQQRLIYKAPENTNSNLHTGVRISICCNIVISETETVFQTYGIQVLYAYIGGKPFNPEMKVGINERHFEAHPAGIPVKKLAQHR